MCSRQATVTVQQAYTERRASHENTESVTNSLMNAIAVQAATNRCRCKKKGPMMVKGFVSVLDCVVLRDKFTEPNQNRYS